jgi:hypothetical protein
LVEAHARNLGRPQSMTDRHAPTTLSFVRFSQKKQTLYAQSEHSC